MKRRGVTLLELLVSVSLLGLLSTGVLLALRLGLGAMEKSNATLLANRRAMSTQRILQSQIAGFMPMPALCASGEDQVMRVPFFDGEPRSMRFVSSYSLAEAGRGYPRILEYQVLPRPDGRGVRLVVNESVYDGPASTGALCAGVAPDPETGQPRPQYRPVEVGPRSFVLADRLAFCRFVYLQPAAAPGGPEQWVAEYRAPGWPRALRVEMAPLDAEASRTPLVTVTEEIRINRVPNWRYAD